jgi:hypothetical protein
MIEPALYVYLPQGFGPRKLIVWHAHGVVWGISKKRLKELCADINKRRGTLIPRVPAVYFKRVEPDDLFKVLGYINKAPRHQYSIGRRRLTDGYTQTKKRLNGVNTVRLHATMRDMHLDDLALGTSWGEDILRTIKDEALEPFRRKRRAGRI